MSNPTLKLGDSNWAVKTNNLLGYAVAETSNKFLPREFTFSRNSTATYTDENGVIQTAAANIARVQDNSLLLEPQRTNLVLQSEDFGSVSWIGSLIKTTNQTTSPDGNNNGCLLQGTGVLRTQDLIQTNFTVTVGVVYTHSVYAKKGTNNFIQIGGGSSSFGSNYFANFDLNNGTVGSVGSSVTRSSIQDVGNGWYRCSVSGPAIATTTANPFIVWLVTLSTSVRAETNTLSTSVYLWGAQLEQGSYATTYIPTTTATATRLADIFTRNNIYTNGLISASGGTWFVELKNNVVIPSGFTQAQTLGLGNNIVGSTADNIFLQASDGTRIRIWKQIAGNLTSIFLTTDTNCKLAIKWNSIGIDVFQNGVKVVTNTPFTPVALDTLRTIATHQPYLIQQMALFNTPLSDDELITMTTL